MYLNSFKTTTLQKCCSEDFFSIFFQIQNNSDQFRSHFNSISGSGSNRLIGIYNRNFLVKIKCKSQVLFINYLCFQYLKTAQYRLQSTGLFLAQHGSLMTQWVKVILLITQKSHLLSFLMLLIKTVFLPFTLKKRD